VSIMTAPSRLDAPKSTSVGTTSANVRFAQFWVEARKRVALHTSWAGRRLDLGGFPPREALVAVRALLRHPLVRAEPGTPEGKWLDELASLVGKACPGSGAQGSRTIAGGPSHGDSCLPSHQPTPGRSRTGGSRDLRSRLDEKQAGKDARTTLKRTREWHREAEEDHASSSSPTRGN
jgi:hypothetical protein